MGSQKSINRWLCCIKDSDFLAVADLQWISLGNITEASKCEIQEQKCCPDLILGVSLALLTEDCYKTTLSLVVHVNQQA